ncbi:MAG: hypothetical protein HC915_17450 [Anaerolineae bacterium]|nr:hypothetical protein [Anaerolineae bacterium]
MQPLAEVFGFPVDNVSDAANRHRKNRLCPYNNRVPNCTKDKANEPLGVCSIFDTSGEIAITCPVRFRQDWVIAENAASFFFPDHTWTSLSEVRLNDRDGVSAGNIDIVLVAYAAGGHIIDFGALEVQAVYVSGNVRQPFERYLRDTPAYLADAQLSNTTLRPRADYLSSSRKRLVPQLIYKGSILKAWNKKQAVALHKNFFATLPLLEQVPAEAADMAWLIYDLQRDLEHNIYRLTLTQMVYTQFKPALDQITTPVPGEMTEFLGRLQGKLDEKRDEENTPPDAFSLDQLL